MRVRQACVTGLAAAAAFLGAAPGLLAGPINPPAGPVAPTNRTMIFSLPFVITEPGSYVLARDLTGVPGQPGIRIEASHVHLDLNGFTLRGGPGTLSGILVVGPRAGIVIRNGTITLWGGRGIEAPESERLRISNSQIPDNEDDGACTGDDTTVEDTTASGNGDEGIETGDNSKVTDSCVGGNEGTGLVTGGSSEVIATASIANGAGGMQIGPGSRVSGCIARGNTGDGLAAGEGSVVGSCAATGNTGNGLVIGAGASVTVSVARNNGLHGVRALAFATVLNNACDGNGVGPGMGAGVHAAATGARVEGNTLTLNEVGVLADAPAARNLIVRNSLSRNSAQSIDAVTGNTVGEVINAVNNPGLVAANPWANLLY